MDDLEMIAGRISRRNKLDAFKELTTLRDQFACAALGAIINEFGSDTVHPDVYAASAYTFADAMLKARAVVSGETRDEAKAKLTTGLESKWPDERVTDIEIVNVDVVNRPVIVLAS